MCVCVCVLAVYCLGVLFGDVFTCGHQMSTCTFFVLIAFKRQLLAAAAREFSGMLPPSSAGPRVGLQAVVVVMSVKNHTHEWRWFMEQ